MLPVFFRVTVFLFRPMYPYAFYVTPSADRFSAARLFFAKAGVSDMARSDKADLAQNCDFADPDAE